MKAKFFNESVLFSLTIAILCVLMALVLTV